MSTVLTSCDPEKFRLWKRQKEQARELYQEFIQSDATNYRRSAAPTHYAIVDHERRTVQLSFASEYPAVQSYKSGNFLEVIEISERAADLSLLNAGAPLLLEHNPYLRIGDVERAWIGNDKRAYAVVRFSTDGLGDHIFKEIIYFQVMGGFQHKVSFRYEPKEGVITPAKRAGDLDQLRVTSWLACEISFCAHPKDPTVGIPYAA